MGRYKNAAMFEIVDELYPMGIIGGLKAKNEKVYDIFQIMAKEKGKTLKAFFESNGYQYFRVTISEMRDSDKSDLLKLFPNKRISNLSQRDSKLYFKILNHSKIEHTSIEDYLTSLGFRYEKYNNFSKEAETLSKLKKLYPDKKVKQLSAKDQSLYLSIYKIAKREDATVAQYLHQRGYKVKA